MFNDWKHKIRSFPDCLFEGKHLLTTDVSIKDVSTTDVSTTVLVAGLTVVSMLVS